MATDNNELMRQKQYAYSEYGKTTDKLAQEGVDLTVSIAALSIILGQIIAQLPKQYRAAACWKCQEFVEASIENEEKEGKAGTAIMCSSKTAN